MKALAHPRRRNQMLELQRDLRALLRQTAICKRVRKLVRFSNAQQKLRLRDEPLREHAFFFRRSRKRREVHIRGNVLFTRSFIRILAHRMLPNRLHRSAMPSRKLLAPCKPIVDDDHESPFQRSRSVHVHLRLKRNLHALSSFRMNRISVKKLELICRRWNPGFHESPVARINTQRSLWTHNLNRNRIEELVGKDDCWNRVELFRRWKSRLVRVEMPA